ncbi:MAG: hypothetical protein ACI8UO_002773 [Verrucomicrobiales bacterium]|jgi:hypothetical protein
MKNNLLKNTRAYLSGPMDFVGSRVVEKYLGWRAILAPILRALSVTVLDPWNKPPVLGHADEYGAEGLLPAKAQYELDFWTNSETRARFEQNFWETVHIDLRMTDISDFVVTFVPTNIYSVGTVHEIITARNQLKPVLLVSPPIKYDFFPALENLTTKQREALKFYGLKENPHGLPSQWYGNIVGGHNMFDGFGWESLEFKAPDFYENLIAHVLEIAAENLEDNAARIRWNEIREWVENFTPLKSLSGGVLEHVTFPDANERQLLDNALAKKAEQERQFFWYNHQYQPKRPFLYHLLSIASGHIPPKVTIIPEMRDDASVEYRKVCSVDDNWLLLAAENM